MSLARETKVLQEVSHAEYVMVQGDKKRQKRKKGKSEVVELTTEKVKCVLKSPHKPLVLFALTFYANLKDNELNTLICRHLRGLTQEEVAELLDRSTNTIQNWEKSGLEKCAKAWAGNQFINQILIQDKAL